MRQKSRSPHVRQDCGHDCGRGRDRDHDCGHGHGHDYGRGRGYVRGHGHGYVHDYGRARHHQNHLHESGQLLHGHDLSTAGHQRERDLPHPSAES